VYYRARLELAPSGRDFIAFGLRGLYHWEVFAVGLLLITRSKSTTRKMALSDADVQKQVHKQSNSILLSLFLIVCCWQRTYSNYGDRCFVAVFLTITVHTLFPEQFRSYVPL